MFGNHVVTLENYINRYNFDTRLLEKHPEYKEMLSKKVEDDKRHIMLMTGCSETEITTYI